MTELEFVEATSRIEQYFEKEYSKEQRKIMYEELKEFSAEKYKRLVSAVIRKNKYLPKVADFIEVNKEDIFTPQQNKTEKIECKKCNSTGYIIYTKSTKDGGIEIKNQYGAVCDCGNAKKYEGWNMLDSRHKSNYYTPNANELGLFM